MVGQMESPRPRIVPIMLLLARIFIDMDNYCGTCELCQKDNPKSPPRAKMVSLPVALQHEKKGLLAL